MPSKPEANDKRALLMVLLAFSVFSILFNLFTPFKTPLFQAGLPDIGAPDEAAHVRYVEQLVTEKRFPRMDVNVLSYPIDSPKRLEYESHQPPLYYLLLAPIQAIPMGLAAKGFLLRLVSTLIGVATLVCLFKLLREVFPEGYVPIVGTAFAALLPMQLALFSSVNNDTLTEFWFTFVAMHLVNAIKNGWAKKAIPLGIGVGGALLTKSTGVLLLPLLVCACFLTVKSERTNAIKIAGAAAGLGLLIAAAWIARNLTLYGDPFALRVFNEAFASTATREVISQMQQYGLLDYYTDWIGWFTVRTYWGWFGYLLPQWPQLMMVDSLYLALNAFAFVAVFGFVKALVKEKKRESLQPIWLLLISLGLVAASFIGFTLTFAQGQARYFSPAMPAIALVTAWGWLMLFPKPMQRGAGVGLCVMMVLLALYACFGVVKPGFETLLSSPGM